jgi:protein-tyrosine phosphatase
MAIAASHGFDLSDHRARHIRLQDTRQYSHVVALDRDSLAMVRAIRPDGVGLSLIDDHADGMMAETISDLLTGGPAELAAGFLAIDAAARGLATEFALRRLPPPTQRAPILAAAV